MGLEKDVAQGRTYLSIAFGKIRQKRLENGVNVDENTPGAVKRETQSGENTWAIEYRAISGMITGIYYKENDGYSNTYEVIVTDGPDVFQVSFKEETVFLRDFMEKFPNIDLSKRVQISPYDYEKDGKRRIGVSIEQDGEKVYSFYKKYDDKSNTVTEMNGFPSAKAVDFKKESQRKIFNIKVDEFLKDEFTKLIASRFKDVQQKPKESVEDYRKNLPNDAPMPTQEPVNSENLEDDLPF